jgi:hypothetical protein
MKKLCIFLAVVCLILAGCLWFRVGFFAGEGFEARVNNIEQKLDLILETVQKRSGEPKSSPQPLLASAESPGEKIATSFEKGASGLQSGARLSAYIVTQASAPTPQIGTPIESFVDTSSAFSIGNFLATPSSKTFEQHQVGVKWEGFLYFDEGGTYMFSAGISHGGAYRVTMGVAQLTLKGNVVVKCSSSDSAPALGTIEIAAPGKYRVEVWLAPVTAAYDRNLLSCQFQFRKQGAAEFVPINPGALYTEK